MHMVSKKDLNSSELETMRTSRSPTTVMTANGEVKTREEATVCVKPIGLTRQSYVSWRNSRSWRDSVRIFGIHTTGSAVKNHISSEMAKELIAIFRTMYHLWFLVYRRVLPQLHLHLLLHHLHHRVPYLMSTDTPKIKHQKEVEARVGGVGETRCMNPQKPKNKNKNGESEEVGRFFSHELPDRLQEFRESLVAESISTALVKPRTGNSRHFQVISWTSSGAASKSGTGFGKEQCIYALSEGPILWHLHEDEK